MVYGLRSFQVASSLTAAALAALSISSGLPGAAGLAPAFGEFARIVKMCPHPLHRTFLPTSSGGALMVLLHSGQACSTMAAMVRVSPGLFGDAPHQDIPGAGPDARTDSG